MQPPSFHARPLLGAAVALLALAAVFIPVDAQTPFVPQLALGYGAHSDAPVVPASHAAPTTDAGTCPPPHQGSCYTCMPPQAPGPNGTCTCPPPNTTCCPYYPQPCCPGAVPPNHCCGPYYNPSGDPAACCSMYRVNCCDPNLPSFDPTWCLCVTLGTCPVVATQPEAAPVAVPRDAAPPLSLPVAAS